MSTERPPVVKRKTVRDIGLRKGGEPLVCLTAYTAPVAQILDDAVDLLLVGDSLGMVVYGFDSTLPVTLRMMIDHGAAVVRATRQACIVVDLPFGSYQIGAEQAFKAAHSILAETAAGSVKLEGGAEMAPTVRFLVERGVPVMGHVGLMPQHARVLGGFRAQGRESAEADRIAADARAIADAGAFALVIEGVAEPLARRITAEVPIPTIGIGASAACDGQILVTDDMIGLFQDFTPRFVKRYATIGEAIGTAAAQYAADVRARSFPGPEHVFKPKAA